MDIQGSRNFALSRVSYHTASILEGGYGLSYSTAGDPATALPGQLSDLLNFQGRRSRDA